MFISTARRRAKHVHEHQANQNRSNALGEVTDQYKQALLVTAGINTAAINSAGTVLNSKRQVSDSQDMVRKNNPAAAVNASEYEQMSNTANSHLLCGSSAVTNLSSSGTKLSFTVKTMVGQGTFGAVFLATVNETNDSVAIKRVLLDRGAKSRELQIMKQLQNIPHPFIVELKYHFISRGNSLSNGQGQPEEYLNLAMDYLPETLYSTIRSHAKRRDPIPTVLIKSYLFQLLRALAHIHGLGIVHRDVKPQNLLVDPVRCILKLADFGSAKPLIHGESNLAYIGSRYYRAPELIMGNGLYTYNVDIWSAGCVFGEMLLGTPLFPGMSAADQMIEIVKVLGSPNDEQMRSISSLNESSCGDFVTCVSMKQGPLGRQPSVKVPSHIPAKGLNKVFPSTNSQCQTIPLISALLEYNPNMRMKAIDACAHPYFNQLRLKGIALPRGATFPRDLFDFTKEELSLVSADRRCLLLPLFSNDGANVMDPALSASVRNGRISTGFHPLKSTHDIVDSSVSDETLNGTKRPRHFTFGAGV